MFLIRPISLSRLKYLKYFSIDSSHKPFPINITKDIENKLGQTYTV